MVAYRANRKAKLRVFANNSHKERVPGNNDSRPQQSISFYLNPQQWYVGIFLYYCMLVLIGLSKGGIW